jgi:hypothetical protein
VEDAIALASAIEDAEGLVQKVTILEGELVEACQAREMAEEKFHILSDASANGARWLVVSKMDQQQQFEELPLLRAWSAELCLAIVGPLRARNHLLKRMQTAAICHIEMAMELATLQVTVTSTVELVLGHSSDETFRVEITNELVAQFRKLVVLCSQLEWPSMRIYDLLLGLPPD